MFELYIAWKDRGVGIDSHAINTAILNSLTESNLSRYSPPSDFIYLLFSSLRDSFFLWHFFLQQSHMLYTEFQCYVCVCVCVCMDLAANCYRNSFSLTSYLVRSENPKKPTAFVPNIYA